MYFYDNKDNIPALTSLKLIYNETRFLVFQARFDLYR